MVDGINVRGLEAIVSGEKCGQVRSVLRQWDCKAIRVLRDMAPLVRGDRNMVGVEVWSFPLPPSEAPSPLVSLPVQVSYEWAIPCRSDWRVWRVNRSVWRRSLPLCFELGGRSSVGDMKVRPGEVYLPAIVMCLLRVEGHVERWDPRWGRSDDGHHLAWPEVGPLACGLQLVVY